MSAIHETAIISDGAQLGEGVTVGAYSIIGPHVVIGKNTAVASHVVIEGYTTFGEENQIFQFASIGSRPQDLKFKGEKSRLVVGNKNLIREYVTLQPGTEGGGMETRVGNGNLFMVSSHLGHDSQVGNDNIIANCVALAGHVTVGNRVTLGGLCAVHQFCRVGDSSMVAGGAIVTQDIVPYTIVQGDRARTCGVNVIGMERAGLSSEEISAVRKVYKLLFLKGSGSLKERIALARTEHQTSAAVTKVLDFIELSQRGIAPIRKGNSDA